MVETNSHRFNNHVKRLSLSASVVITIITHLLATSRIITSDFIWPFLPPYMEVIPNPKVAFIFPISCILVLIFLIFMIYFELFSQM